MNKDSTVHRSKLILSFIQINMVSLTTTIRRSGIVVAGLVVTTAITSTNRKECKLILILRAFSGGVTWMATLEAESIVRTGSRSLRHWSWRSELHQRWRRHTWCSI